MQFKVVTKSSNSFSDDPNTVFLVFKNWNDDSFLTLYTMIYIDQNLKRHTIGDVRIGITEQKRNKRMLKDGTEFNYMGEKFFSLGVGTLYYENLNHLEKDIRENILKALRDMAFLPDVFDIARGEEVTYISLFRGLNVRTVEGQYRRMANGGVKLTTYNFWFNSPKMAPNSPEMRLAFAIEPDSNPPTNVHVIIGRNGVGKTTLINNMHQSLFNGEKDYGNGVYFNENVEKFVNVVYVSFSAFDTEKPVFDQVSPHTEISFKYIGLKKKDDNDSSAFKIKNGVELAYEFLSSFNECVETFKTEILIKSLSVLESDPNFKEADILQLIDLKGDERFGTGLFIFDKLSSGHKIILLSITRLVETIQEKSLVFIDEPEGHLHPPLLSAFTRSLSELLININGVAIIATHSPVILQEVPKKCVYKLRKFGINAFADRPEIESFGENVGVLTREVLGLEVTDSGFYQLLKKAVDKFDTYEDLIADFDGSLGMEARSMARVLFANKKIGF